MERSEDAEPAEAQRSSAAVGAGQGRDHTFFRRGLA